MGPALVGVELPRLLPTQIHDPRRVVVGVIGGTAILVGILLFFLPGPGIVVLAAGLGLLSVEFAWARRWLAKLRRGISDASRHARIKRSG